MSPETTSQCLTIIQEMRSNQSWNDTLLGMYAAVLADLDDDTGQKTITHIFKTQAWRPAPSEILDMARKITGTAPLLPDAVFAEIMEAARVHGRAAVPAGYPNCWYDGEPQWSSPVVAEAVRMLGGYDRVISGEAGSEAALRNAVARIVPAIQERKQIEQSVGTRLPRIPGLPEIGKAIR